MKKWIAILLATVLTLGLLAGCQSISNISDLTHFQTNEDYSEEKLLEITEALSDGKLSNSHKGGVPWLTIDGYGSHYLGQHNGYDMLLITTAITPGMVIELLPGVSIPEDQREAEAKLTESKRTQKIGESTFYPALSRELYVHKDGEFLPLKDAYEQGLISEDAIETAAQNFNHYLQYCDSIGEEELQYRDFKYFYFKKHQYPDWPLRKYAIEQITKYKSRLISEGYEIPEEFQ